MLKLGPKVTLLYIDYQYICATGWLDLWKVVVLLGRNVPILTLHLSEYSVAKILLDTKAKKMYNVNGYIANVSVYMLLEPKDLD